MSLRTYELLSNRLFLHAVSYLEEFIAAMKARGYRSVSLMGFSAGSMLALAMAARADEIDRATNGAASNYTHADPHHNVICEGAINQALACISNC